MIDPLHPLASWYLWIVGVLFLVTFALPLLLAPLTWARWFQWPVPGDPSLAEYFGSCLGAAAVAITVAALRAAPRPVANVLVLDLVIVAGALLALVHVWGKLRRAWPWTETAEIALYGAATVAGLWIRTTI